MEGMFAGQKFWFSNTVPQRSRFMEEVKANSGEVVPLEKQADICLYDHARKNPPPGMYSYRYVEHSVRKGQREDLEAHRIGGVSSRAERPVGSVTLASKGARIPFTEADDQMLWDWLKPIDGLRGSAGNAIYQQLEKENPRHTYQSWRDRWLKYVQFQKRELSGSGQRQRIAAQAVEHQTTPKEKRRETNVDVKCADPSPRIVVEVPVRDSPRRKRGRPRKTERDESNDDTIEVSSPVMSRQTPKSTRSMKNGKGEESQPDRTPKFKPDLPAGSWEFSDMERDLLLNAAEVILEAPEDVTEEAWKRMAKNYPAHTAQQWREHFEKVIVLLHRNQQPNLLERKTTSDTIDSELGNGMESAHTGTESVRIKKELGVERGISLERTRENRNGDSGTLQIGKMDRKLSPSFEPDSPVDWRSDSERPRPSPNESRKRSPAKPNSQESTTSQVLDAVADSAETPPQISGEGRKRKDDTGEIASPTTKRRKLSVPEITILEIASTPEESETLEDLPGNFTFQESETLDNLPGTPTLQESETLEDWPGTPTPRARKRPGRRFEDSFSPIFVPADSEGEEDILPINPERIGRKAKTDPETRTSSISVHLVSDHDPINPFNSSVLNENAEPESMNSPTPEFETAPDFSQIHEDTSVSEPDNQDEFETAAEEPTPQRPTTKDTQALFADPTPNALVSFDFALPEPEGGWATLDADSAESKDDEEILAVGPSSPSASSATSSSPDIDACMRLHAAEGQDMDLLLTATQATNMHAKLADMVYGCLERGEEIPSDVKGVWTKEDDEVLMGSNAREIKRVEGKHGQKSVKERWEVLGMWNA